MSGGRDDSVSPLESPAIGTSSTDLVEACEDEGPCPAETPPVTGRPEHVGWRRDLALTKASFARFEPELCRRLVYRGWWLAGAVLSRYHRSLLPDQLSSWTDPR